MWVSALHRMQRELGAGRGNGFQRGLCKAGALPTQRGQTFSPWLSPEGRFVQLVWGIPERRAHLFDLHNILHQRTKAALPGSCPVEPDPTETSFRSIGRNLITCVSAACRSAELPALCPPLRHLGDIAPSS